jgi:hypothetical protein
MKTVRFTQVVEACGRPRVHTSWAAPGKDCELQRALAASRVMTIAHARGKTDFGTVGLPPRHEAGAGTGDQLLVFPRSLKRFAGTRMVGVKFDLVEQPSLTTAGLAWRAGPPKQKRPPHPAAETPARLAPPAREATRSRAPAPPRSPPRGKRAPSASPLVHDIRAAMHALEQGNSVAAFRMLEHALGNA